MHHNINNVRMMDFPVRGQHANKKSEVVLINVAGRSKIKVKDGEGK